MSNTMSFLWPLASPLCNSHFIFLSIQNHWNALCSERGEGILQTGRKVRWQEGKKSIENQEFWVPRHNPHNQMIPAPGLWRSALARKEAGPGGIFSNPSHYFKGKHIKKQEVSGSKWQKNCTQSDRASCFSHQAAGWGGGKWENDRIQGWPEWKTEWNRLIYTGSKHLPDPSSQHTKPWAISGSNYIQLTWSAHH